MLKRILSLLLAVFMLSSVAFAEDVDTVNLPGKLKYIEDEAFEGDWSLDAVVLPDTVREIGSRAFANSSMRSIRIPGDCTIAADAFAECFELTVDTVSGSRTASFATANIPMVVRTYPAGSYTVGETIPANVYVIRAKGGTGTVTLRGGDRSGVFSRSFVGDLILGIRSGEELTMHNCTAIVDYEFDQSNHLVAGLDQSMLRVGVDVDAGEYDVIMTQETGTVTWYQDYYQTVTKTLTIDADFIEQGRKLELNDGEIVYLDGVRLPKADGVTTYRALLIAQDYEGTNMQLIAPPVDARNVKAMLGTMSGSAYRITTVQNKTAAEIMSLVRSAFSGADDDDVCLFYYSGHGAKGGALIGVDGINVTPAMLRTQLDKVQGSKVLIVDACYSGGMITPVDGEEDDPLAVTSANAAPDDLTGKGVETAEATLYANSSVSSNAASSFVSSFANAFMPVFTARSAGLFNEEDYYVLAACAANEESYERKYTVNGKITYFGIFTYYLNRGCGWNEISESKLSTLFADSDGNNQLTMAELYKYTKASVTSAMTGSGYMQTVTAYPSGSSFVLFEK